jgi:hypothetical protein
MIAEMGGQRFALLKHGHLFGEPFHVAPRPRDGLEVLFELFFEDDFAHVRR